jgi:hypothetical protein
MTFRHLLFAALALAAPAQSGELILRIPPTAASFDAGGNPVNVTVWGSVSRVSAEVVRLALTADLGEFQHNILPILRSQLNRSDRCGERLSMEQAALVPAPPDSILNATVHYERWGCMKALGKEVNKRLVGGNAVLSVKLTPSVEANALSLKAEVVRLQADGSLGELLRSGSVGDALKEKIAASIRSSIQKAANFNNVLPPRMGGAVTIRSVAFTSGQEDRLLIDSAADAGISPENLKLLGKQLESH